jgi:hypothetical protein
VPTSTRTAQSGSTLRTVTTPFGPPLNAGAACARSSDAGPAASIAVTARSAARPKSSKRPLRTGSSGAGPRSPEAPICTAGSPAASTTPCPETVSGTARRIHWPDARAPPGLPPASARTAASTVRCSASGAGSDDVDHGTTHGLRTRTPARSPRTSTASTGCPAVPRAHARAPA